MTGVSPGEPHNFEEWRAAGQVLPSSLRASVVPRVIGLAEDMLEKDLRDNRNIGDLGARHLLEQTNPRGGKVTVLTHCNTGALATAGYGTALGEEALSIDRAWEVFFVVQGKAL